MGKNGSSLYTVENITTYPELRTFTNRLFNKVTRFDGFLFYVGIKKTGPVGIHDPNRVYRRILGEAIKRLDEFCTNDGNPSSNFVLALDERGQRDALVTKASRSMFGRP